MSQVGPPGREEQHFIEIPRHQAAVGFTDEDDSFPQVFRVRPGHLPKPLPLFGVPQVEEPCEGCPYFGDLTPGQASRDGVGQLVELAGVGGDRVLADLGHMVTSLCETRLCLWKKMYLFST